MSSTHLPLLPLIHACLISFTAKRACLDKRVGFGFGTGRLKRDTWRTLGLFQRQNGSLRFRSVPAAAWEGASLVCRHPGGSVLVAGNTAAVTLYVCDRRPLAAATAGITVFSAIEPVRSYLQPAVTSFVGSVVLVGGLLYIYRFPCAHGPLTPIITIIL